MTAPTVTATLRQLSRPRITVKRAAALGSVALALFIGWLWLRSSSLVAVRQVSVSGLSGADAAKLRATLVGEAEHMTTLNASVGRLQSAVSGFPYIAGISIATHFPHGLSISVREQNPVAVSSAGGVTQVLDAAGQPLSGTRSAGLPKVASTQSHAALAVLGSAPYQLLSHITNAVNSSRHGVIVQLRNGPQLFFGQAAELAAKWRAAVAALASKDTNGAAYIDVSDPDQPAAGS